MNAVGIDVSKGKSTVVILRPFGEIVVSPYEVKHTDSEITALIKRINAIDGETRIVMEHTGHYYEQLLIRFAEAGLFATAVNPKLIKDFSTNSLRKVKTKPKDDSVYLFLSKKRAEGKPYFVYMTATANKFLCVYYGKVNEYLDSVGEK